MHHTTSPDTLPAIGQTLASKTTRAGGAERLRGAAVHKTIAVARAHLPSAAALLTNLARLLLPTTGHHAAQTRSWLPTGPGIGTILRLGLL